MSNLLELPEDLPIPHDDGACRHLPGMAVPASALMATSRQMVSLNKLATKPTVLYIYPMTGRPDRQLPDDWDAVPGARGCTPQACSFRDHYQDLQALGVAVYGLSTQPTAYQQEAKTRLHLPFELLSDADLNVATALNLPTFRVDTLSDISPDINPVLIKRITLILLQGVIEKVFYPVFPATDNARHVLTYLQAQV
jgi:peroxiredoxin